MSQESQFDIRKKAEEYYKLSREQIVHEDNLINNRTNWLLAGQGLLFAAFGVVFDNTKGLEAVPAKVAFLMKVFPPVGILLTVFTFLSVLGAALAMDSIKVDWEKRLEQMSVPEIETYLPPAQCKGCPKYLGFVGPFLIPIMFVAAWIAIWIWAI